MDADGNSEATISWGSEFWLADKNGTLVQLDEVTEMPSEQGEADDVDVTHFKSPGRRKEYQAGLIDPSTSTLGMNWVPGSPTHLLIMDAHASGDPRAYREVITDGTENKVWQVDGFLIVKSKPRTVAIGEKKTMQVNVRFTGAITEKKPTGE